MKQEIHIFEEQRESAKAQEKSDAMPTMAKANVKRKFNGEMLIRRIDYAKFLLTQTSVPLEKIAVDCGWKSERTFTVVFRHSVGVTPVHYRNWHQC
jgi:transcriptional regulator GlxA family with amidase domain